MGLLLSCYPVISNKVVQKQQVSLLSSYHDSIKREKKSLLNEQIKKAREYNKSVYRRQNKVSLEMRETEVDDYEEQLKVEDSNVMACIEIPKIALRLPIYHGTTQEVLSEGIGHLEGSSLPIGGNDTRCILTGHRGLPRAKLFVRLDELAKGDFFFLEACGKKLMYEVKQIEVIKPQEVERLKINQGKDLVSLVTCTPYGINTNRLVVTGERVKKEGDRQEIKANIPSIRECVFDLLPFLFCFIALLRIVKEGRKKKMNKKRGRTILVILLVGILIGNKVRASELNEDFKGVITIENDEQSGNKGKFLCNKIAEWENGFFVMKPEYEDFKIDLNHICTAEELKQTTEKIDPKENSSTITAYPNREGEVRFDHLQEGVYYIRNEGEVEKTMVPVLVSIPVIEAKQRSDMYEARIVPKYINREEKFNKTSPKTGDSNVEIKKMLEILLICLSAIVLTKIFLNILQKY